MAFVMPNRNELDLFSPESIAQVMRIGPWDGILNLAAYTGVDRAEDDVEMAWQINARAPETLAKLTDDLQIPIVHLSTDYVFSGELGRPYCETDAVDPISVYGKSKEAGERAVRAGNAHHVILRTSWLVGPDGQNFLKTMLRLAGEREIITVVGDQRGTPTSAVDLAAALIAIVTRLMADPHAPFGTFHFANQGEADWAELAETILQYSREMGGPTARIEPITTAEYPTRAKRPKDARLDAGAFDQAYGFSRRPWQSAVREILMEILTGDGR
jgi:dTDP-4-dehydrorhamnose reductase